MLKLPVLSAVLLVAATPAIAQVTVDLHALQALPSRPTPSPPSRPVPSVAALPAPSATRVPAVAGTPSPAPATTPVPTVATRGTPPPAKPAPSPAQPALPEAVPDTASIAPIAPPAPAANAKPPPPVSATATTQAATTATGARLTFAPGESELSPDGIASIKHLTEATPTADTTTFNVLAYAPGRPDDPSTARRISLSRAMAVRGALVADGVPSARIFVRALGEQYGSGPPDRVDISIQGPANAAAAQ